VDIRFVLGPAGSGKTHRCLAEVRDELTRRPVGSPLLFLSPKQSTFQLERQLLAEDGLRGWARLQVLSFERLAHMVMSEVGPVELLDEQGRIMVLRALLRWHQPRLRVFRASARMTGFAREVSLLLRELQRQRVGADRLETFANELQSESASLADKLRDLAVIGRAYRSWLEEHRLGDLDLLPELAAERLRTGVGARRFGAVWLDGFAEMTPAELELLAAVAQASDRTTLAFCVEGELREEPSWMSTWAVVGQTVRRVQTRLAALEGARVRVEVLKRSAGGRFQGNPVLGHLEEHWTRPVEATEAVEEATRDVLRLVNCSDFEREAEVAAREVWRHVRKGGRFREVAVMVRTLDGRDATLRRVFLRYGIPFFIDRRESLAHHPLAELTRCALRLAVGPSRHEDWFGALKTGLGGAALEWVDAWENDALSQGWISDDWLAETPDAEGRIPDREWMGGMARCAEPFRVLKRALAGEPSGHQLAEALEVFWETLEVERQLNAWSALDERQGGQLELQSRLHGSAWEQIRAWVGSLRRGFEDHRMPIQEWLAIVDAGLTTLSAGVIPPSQDQVMIGAVDRSRQPELRLALVLGLNEGVFPTVSTAGGLLTDADRDRLTLSGMGVDLDRRRRIGQERYLGYVAMTRSGGRLVLTWSERDEAGRAAGMSAFVNPVRVMFPMLPVESSEADRFDSGATVSEVAQRIEHRSEVLPWLLSQPGSSVLDGYEGGDVLWRERLRRWRRVAGSGRLSSGIVLALYGTKPEVSVSALESMAACPFQFFVRAGLRGRERRTFEVDRRSVGSWAHELLARFHFSLDREGKRWRELSGAEASERMRTLGLRALPEFGGGVFLATPEARWEAEGWIERLSEVVAVLVEWMSTYRFDPVLAEVAFGSGEERPAWETALGEGRQLRVRGKADRIDRFRDDAGRYWQVVMDYKLGRRRLDDRLLRAGVDMQLAAYALALSGATGKTEAAGATEHAMTTLAGFFYIPLAGDERVESRLELESPLERSQRGHKHRGKLRAEIAPWFDAGQPGESSGQFALRFKKDGTLSKIGDGCSGEVLDQLLETVQRTVENLGRSLFEGRAEVAPYRLGSQTACDRCDLRPICRFDAWTESYRWLD